MSAVVDAIRAELVEWRAELAVRSEMLDASASAVHVAWVERTRARERVAEANQRIDALVSALHLLGERDGERSVEVPDDEGSS